MRLNEQQIRCLLTAAVNLHLRQRAWLLDALTVSSEYTHELTCDDNPKVGSSIVLEAAKYPDVQLTLGAVVRLNKKTVGMVYQIKDDQITVDILSDGSKACFNMLDVFDIPSATVQQVFGNHPFSTEKWGDTTVGRFILNVVILQYPFNWQVFRYVNSQWKPDDIVKLVKDTMLAKKITVKEYEKFWNYLYFIGHMTELNTPSMTVKSLQTDPRVPELKKKFIEEHKGQMHDPLVIQQLEEMLIKADKEYLGDDPSMTFFQGLGSKTFGVSRKKLFLTVGGIPGFGGDAGDMDFIPNSLSEGWTKEAIPSIANETRKGSYERGVATAKGGAETKLVMRAFQDVSVVEDDCGTKRTIKVDCSLFDGKVYIGRTIRVGDMDVIVTAENLDKYVTGKVIHLYSPLTCETKHNFCVKCCGHGIRELGGTQLGIQTIKVTNGYMYMSMKNMHGTILKVKDNKLEDIFL